MDRIRLGRLERVVVAFWASADITIRLGRAMKISFIHERIEEAP